MDTKMGEKLLRQITKDMTLNTRNCLKLYKQIVNEKDVDKARQLLTQLTLERKKQATYQEEINALCFFQDFCRKPPKPKA